MIKVIIGNNMGRSSYIVDENTTIRNALEEHNIDYSTGMTSLDGSTLRAGDMDKTFKDFGISERCILMNIVKADNAAGVKVLGNACLIESCIQMSVLEKVLRYHPEALVLKQKGGDDGTMEEVFRIALSEDNSDISQYGATFIKAPSADAAIVNLSIPSGVSDVKEWIRDRYGVALIRLSQMEEALKGVVSKIDEETEMIEKTISVL